MLPQKVLFRRLAIGFAASLFILTTLYSQHADLRGVVADSLTGERIPYANIFLAGTNRGSATNANGFYLIPSVPFGAYDVTVSVLGYKRQTKRIVVQDDTPNIVNFRLSGEAVELDEIVVSGQAKSDLQKIQTSIHVVDKSEMQLVPVAAQPDVFRSIQILPGIVSTSDVNAQFYVRGGASDQNLILLDGMRIYNPYHAFGIFSTLDPDIIRTTEIYTGAFPSEFGNRLSSVINIHSRDGNATQFSGQAHINFLSSKIQLEGPVGERVQTIASARKSLFSNTLQRFTNEQTPLSFYDGLFKITLQSPNLQDKYTLQTFVSGDDLRAENSSEPSYVWNTRAVGVKADLLSHERIYWDLVSTFTQFQQERRIESGRALVPAVNIVHEFNLRAHVTHYTDTQSLFFFGFEFNFPKYEYRTTNHAGYPVNLHATLVETSTWTRYQSTIGGLNVDGGIRVEVGMLLRGRSATSSIQPRLNVSGDAGGTWGWKAAVGRFGQEVINISNEDEILPVMIPWVAIDRSLDAQWADHVVLGIEGNVLSNLSLTLQGFFKHYGSLVTYNVQKFDVFDPDYINATARAFGGETLIRFSHPLVDVYLAHTVAWVRINSNGFIYAPRYDRRHTANILFALHPAKNLDVSVRWEFGSGLPFTQTVGFYDKLTFGKGYPDPYVYETGFPFTVYGSKNAARLPTYHRLDLSVSYRFELAQGFQPSLGLNLINVYDRKNIFYYERQTGRRVNMLGFLPTASLSLEFRP